MLLMMSVLAVARPGFAQVRDPTLSDLRVPGSVIVFPKFIKGAVKLPEGELAPRSELEIAVVCPKGVICSEHQQVKIRFHWVCGTSETNQPVVLSAMKPTSTLPLRCSRRSCSSLTAASLACRPKSCPRLIVREGI
jgi:hypothetical protein